LDCPLDRLALALDPDTLSRGRHRHDPEIHPGREAAIEAYFLFAEVSALSESAEIEEIEVNGFLHLVDKGARQEDDRDVCLAHLDCRHGIRIRGGIGQCFNQVRKLHAGPFAPGETANRWVDPSDFTLGDSSSL